MAIGVNLLFVLLLLFSRARTASEPVAAAMIWMAVEESRVVSRQASRPSAKKEPLASAPEIPQITMPLQPEPSPVAEEPTQGAAPSIDWNAAAAKASRDFVGQQETQSRGSVLESKPSVLAMPSAKKHKAGDSEHFEGGEVITWANDLCYDKLDAMRTSIDFRRICKTRSKSERNSDQRAEALEKAVKPRYLGGKRLPPETIDAAAEVQ
ncbi:MAG: hypothetical protein WDO12_12075 [Pseudomonadota bacterium]